MHQITGAPSRRAPLVQTLAIGAYALGAAATDLADNLAGDHLTHDGRHKAGGSELGTLMDVGRVAGLCLNRFLAAKQYMQTLDSALLAFFAHDAAHGVTYRIENVGKAEALGMELVGSAHGANQTNAVVLSIFGNGELGRDGVDGVDDVVELAVRLLQNAREKFVDIVAQQVFGALDDGSGWIDVVDHGFHNIDLALADGALKGDGLAIDIAGRDDVLIQNDEMTNATAGKCLAAIGAHTSAAAPAPWRRRVCRVPRGP